MQRSWNAAEQGLVAHLELFDRLVGAVRHCNERARGVAEEVLDRVPRAPERICRTARSFLCRVTGRSSRGLGAIDRMLQGSVSEHVATHAEATVVIAH